MPRKGLTDKEAWEDIGGMYELKNLIEHKILLPLQNRDLAEKHGVIIPKTILLFGPPGTGKTIFARAIARRLGWSIIGISSVDIRSGCYGERAKGVQQLMEELRRKSKTVIFFDELEELVRRRTKEASDIDRQVTNEFLRQLPELRKTEDILVVCATNYVEQMDPAALRPGRFDYIMPVDLPDLDARKEIFRIRLKNMVVGNLSLVALAKETEGFTPADIVEVCNRVAQMGFEREYFKKKTYTVTTRDFIKVIKQHEPTVSEKELAKFKEAKKEFGRAIY